MPYTIENTQVVKDPNGNVIDFTDLLNQYNNIQTTLSNLTALVKTMYADVPSAIPQDVITAFNLS